MRKCGNDDTIRNKMTEIASNYPTSELVSDITSADSPRFPGRNGRKTKDGIKGAPKSS